MAGHLFILTQIKIAAIAGAKHKKINITAEQARVIAGEVNKDDLIFVGAQNRGGNVTLWMVAKASSGFVHSKLGAGHISLKCIKLKTAQSSYQLSEGIATGDSLKEDKWKKLDHEEVAACFFNTKVYNNQIDRLKSAIKKAIPAGTGVTSDSVVDSVLLNVASVNGGVAVRGWYDAEVLLSQSNFREALKRRLSELDGRQFERLMEAFFRIPGFGFDSVRATRQTRDYGIDLELVAKSQVAGDLIVLGQCKFRNKKVSGPEVRQLKTDMTQFRAAKGIFITISDFTQQAHDFAAKDKRIHLINGERLIDLFFSYAEQSPGIWEIIGKGPKQLTLAQAPQLTQDTSSSKKLLAAKPPGKRSVGDVGGRKTDDTHN